MYVRAGARPLQRYAKRPAPRASGRPPRLFSGGVALSGDRQALGDLLSPFDATVEDWRPLAEQYAGSIPVDFLLAWIQRESDGNPCSWTQYQEAGIFQLMPPDNIAVAGTTLAQMHPVPPCVAGAQSHATFSDLSSAQQNEQMRAGVQYVNYCVGLAQQKLSAAGVTWDASMPDFWMFVKLQHAYPGPTAGWLASATSQLGHPPASWAELRSTINGYSSVLDNAEWVGSFGVGGGISTGDVAVLLLLGLGVVTAFVLTGRSPRRATFAL